MARAFAAHYLAEPIRRMKEAGHTLSHDAALRLLSDAGQRLADLDRRWQGGIQTGQMFITFFWLNVQGSMKSCSMIMKMWSAKVFKSNPSARPRLVTH